MTGEDGFFDEDSDDYSEDQQKYLNNFSKNFKSDVRLLAKHYIDRLFSDQMLHTGGSIPRVFLESERRISMVLNYDIIKGVTRAYKSLEPMLENDVKFSKNSGEATADIILVNNLLNMLSSKGIPQQFAGGLMCMYLELVEGIDIGTDP